MKRIITAILLLAALETSAQQDAMYSQYMFNTLAINPAYAGSRNVVSATGLLRKQWVGIEGAPQTATFTIDAPISNKRVGLGLQLFSDKLGITSTTGVVGSYAYRIRMEKGSLSFGLQGSLSDFKANYSGVALDPYGTSMDVAFTDNIQKTMFNAGAGVYYNSDKFYVGLSSPELFSNKINPSATENGITKQYIHVFLAAGYVFPLTEDFQLKPSVLFKGVQGAPLQADLNGTLWIKNRVALGAQYRTSADISGLVELQVNSQIRVGYQYDRSITSLQNYNTGSHEIMLRYEFGSSQAKILTPRYF
ncbi:MAG: type secretion system rane protein PorP/SprF [Sphingobacteriaceae bacterium]|jgi:type IX secretion system PorP/SprF family membrane protein|nr:type secretion system rane protein PorP/SprF [Sphingobacteriaceae bacterium]